MVLNFQQLLDILLGSLYKKTGLPSSCKDSGDIPKNDNLRLEFLRQANNTIYYNLHLYVEMPRESDSILQTRIDRINDTLKVNYKNSGIQGIIYPVSGNFAISYKVSGSGRNVESRGNQKKYTFNLEFNF